MVLSCVSDIFTVDKEKAQYYLPILSKAGFGALDFSWFEYYLGWHIRSEKPSSFFDKPDEEIYAYIDEIRAEIDKAGLVVGQAHAPFDTLLPRGSKEFNDYLLGVHKKVIELTARLGCKYLVIHPVFCGYEDALDPDEEKRINIDFYSALIPELKKYNVVACLENMWVRKGDFKIYGAICADPNEAAAYVDELNEIAGEECFGFCLDTGHAVLCSMDIVKGVNILGKRIKTVHIHDVDGIKDTHTTPYLGVSDFEKILGKFMLLEDEQLSLPRRSNLLPVTI
jgi:sugar phosphate isomerase/epimerase